MIFVDTNYFLRFLLADNTPQHTEAKTLLLAAAEGKKTIFTSSIVIFELYWVLTSFYGKNKKEVASILEQLLAMHFVEIAERDILNEAVSFYKKSTFDLEDAYNIVYAKAKGAKEFKTFDKKLQRAF
jgi:predicted nucleic-acid-binding protein